MANNLKTVIERLVKEGATASPSTLTATSGSTTTLGATGATFDKTTSTAYQGRVLWVTANANSAGNSPENEARPVSTFSGSTLTVSTAFGASVETSDTAVLLPSGWGKETTLEAINDRIRSLALPRYLPLTLVSDGDMESSSASDWTQIGTATLTKDTSTVLIGKGALKIVTTSVDHGAKSGDILLTEGRQVLVASAVKCAAGSIRVQLWDETNSVEIHGVTVDEYADTEVRFVDTVPNDCELIQIRYLSKTASTTAYIGYSILLPTDLEVYELILGDSTYLDPGRIEGLYSQPAGFPSEVSESYTAFTKAFRPLGTPVGLRDYAGGVTHRIQIPRPTEPLWMMFKATGTALTTMTSETVFPLEPLVAGALWGIYERLWKRWPDGQWLQMARVQERRYTGYLSELGLNTPVKRDWVQRKV